MVAIPQGPTGRCFWTLVFASMFFTGCPGDQAASSQAQRRIGEARLQDDVFVSLTYGAVRGFTDDAIVLRSASPLVEILVETGPLAEGVIDVELRNQHLEADLRIASVTYLDSRDVDGCPEVSGTEIDCVAASEGLGETCTTSGQCPTGLRCAAGVCEMTDLFEGCVAPTFERSDRRQTSLHFELDAAPCRRTRLQTFLPDLDATDDDADDTLRFVVIGPSHEPAMIAGLADEFRARDADFVILLGDNVDAANEDGLIRLERALLGLGTPVVVIAGRREITPRSGEEFLRRFGPHDHVWELRGARFFVFYSALGTLGPRGMSRLESFLAQLQPGDDEPVETPLIGATRIPPLDPDGLRDNAFRNDIEGLQVMSVLEENGVHQLFTGGGSYAEDRLQGVEVFTTTARRTVATPRREWLLVEIAPGEGDGRVVGDRSITVERIEFD